MTALQRKLWLAAKLREQRIRDGHVSYRVLRNEARADADTDEVVSFLLNGDYCG